MKGSETAVARPEIQSIEGGVKTSKGYLGILWWLPFSLLLFLVLTSPDRLIYDEPGHLETISMVRESGWKTAMRETSSAAGPLFPLVHYAFSPVTGLRPVPLRILNLVFVLISAAFVYGISRQIGSSSSCFSAASMFVVPFLWPVFGMALTEGLSMCCMLGFCWLVICFLANTSRRNTELTLGLGAGTMLALACLTRQTTLVCISGIGALPINWKSFRFAALAGLLPLAAMAWLVSVWHGLVPHRVGFISGGARPDHLILAFAYLGMAGLIVSPGFFFESRVAVWLSLAGGLLSFALTPINIVPARTLASGLMSSSLLSAYERVASAGLVLVAILFGSSLLLCAWSERRNRVSLFLILTVGAIACTPFVISHLFSSRYVTAAVPLLILLIWPRVKIGMWLFLRCAMGVAVGAGMLMSYYRGM